MPAHTKPNRQAPIPPPNTPQVQRNVNVHNKPPPPPITPPVQRNTNIYNKSPAPPAPPAPPIDQFLAYNSGTEKAEVQTITPSVPNPRNNLLKEITGGIILKNANERELNTKPVTIKMSENDVIGALRGALSKRYDSAHSSSDENGNSNSESEDEWDD